MAPPQSTALPHGDGNVVEVHPAVIESIEADVQAALDYLCDHAEEWGGEREVADLNRHCRRTPAAHPRQLAG